MKKYFLLCLVLDVVLSPLFPLLPVYAIPASEVSSSLVSPNKIITNPDVKNTSAQADWSTVDWGGEVVLPSDLENHHKQLQDHVNKGDIVPAQNSVASKTKWTDKKAMQHFGVPAKIQTIVDAYKQGQKLTPEYRQALKDEIQSIQLQNGLSAKTPTSTKDFPVIRVKNQTHLRATQLKSSQGKSTLELKSINILPAVNYRKPHETKKLSLRQFFSGFFATPVYADEFAPIIELDEEVETSPFIKGLAFLSSAQNPDGSFGPSRTFSDTYGVFDFLTNLSLTNNSQYPLAVNFLRSSGTTSTIELAQKIRFLHSQGLPLNSERATLLLAQNADGGFGSFKNYTSDILTTVEAAETLRIINYNQNDVLSSALWFILNKIKQNGSVVLASNANPSYLALHRVLTFLQPYQNTQIQRGREIIVVQQKINNMLEFLASQYSVESQRLEFGAGSLDVASVFSDFKKYNVNKEQAKELESILANSQSANGQFGESLESTVASLSALAAPDIALTGLNWSPNTVSREVAELSLTLENRGFVSSSQITAHVFLDNWYFGAVEHLENQGVSLIPGQSAQIQISIPNTLNLLGSTKATVFLESAYDLDDTNNVKSAVSEFLSRRDHEPSLPLFYVAHSYTSQNTPGFNVRWGSRPDPNRINFVIMYRRQGAEVWNFVRVPRDLDGAFLVDNSLVHSGWYEVTVGTEGVGNEITFFSEPSTIRVSREENVYTGSLEARVFSPPAVVPNSLFVIGKGWAQSDGEGRLLLREIPNGTVAVQVTSTPALESFWTRVTITSGEITPDKEIFSFLKEDAAAPQVTSIEVQNLHNNQLSSGEQTVVTINTAENTALSGAHLFLFLPQTNEWNYLGAASPAGTERAEFSWFVPETLIGEGFKLKAIAFDYLNNISAPFESSSFTLINSAPPQFTWLNPTSTTVMALGQNTEIRWDTSPGNFVPRVNIDIFYGNNSDNLALGIENTGRWIWSVPSSSFYAGRNVKLRVRGEDSRNRRSGQTLSEPFSIANNAGAPVSPWASEESITSRALATTTQQYSSATTVVGSDGRLHVVYRALEDNFALPRVVRENLYLITKNVDGTWTEPYIIYTKQTETNSNLDGFSWIDELALQAGNNGELYVLFVSAYSGGCESLNQKEVYLISKNPNGEWSAPVNISRNNTASLSPRLLLDQGNIPQALWSDGATYGADCQIRGNKLLVSKPLVGDHGEQAIPGTTLATFPHFTQAVSGTIHVVYHNQMRILEHKFKTANGWSAAQAVTQTPIMESDCKAGLQNTLHCVTRDDLGTINYFFFDGTRWIAPQEVFGIVPEYTVTLPTVAVDNFNRPHIFATAFFGAERKYKILWRAKTFDGFSPAQSIVRNTMSVSPLQPKVVKRDNTLSTVFSASFEFTDHWFLSQANIAPPVIPPPPVSPAPTSTPSPTSTPAVNLIRDGDMEMASTIEWRRTGYGAWSVFKTPTTSYTGRQSMYLETRTTSSVAYFSQSNIPVERGKRYRLAVRYKLSRGILRPQFTMNNTSTRVNPEIINLNPTNEWRLYTYEFTVPDAFASNFRLEFKLFASGNLNFGFLDDITLTDVASSSTPPLPINLVRDANMEELNMDAWPRYLNPVVLEKTVSTTHSDGQSMRVITSRMRYAGLRQDIPVQAGRRYRFRVWYRVEQGSFRPRLAINSTSDFELSAVLTPNLGPTASQWRLYERVFTVPQNYVSGFRILLRFYNAQGYVDDVSIEEIP